MRYTCIANTDLKPSVICLGTVHVGSTLSLRSSYKLLDAYLEQGGNFLDTAKMYSDWLPGEKSSSEKTLGRWLKLRRTRDKVILATKGANPQPSNMNVMRLSRQQITYDLHRSLKHLQTDVIGLYWLHRDDPCRPVEDIINTLDGLRKAGKIRYFGCSNWRTARIIAAKNITMKMVMTPNTSDWPLSSFPSNASRCSTCLIAQVLCVRNFNSDTDLH